MIHTLVIISFTLLIATLVSLVITLVRLSFFHPKERELDVHQGVMNGLLAASVLTCGLTIIIYLCTR